MNKSDVMIGGQYVAKVSGKLAPVRITGTSRFGGWDAVNVETKKTVRIKSAQRLRRPANEATARAVASDNPLLKAQASEFTDLLGSASLEQLRDALTVETLGARKRSRIEAALKNRTGAAEPPAADDGIARTVEAMTTGDLTQGVTIPTAQAKLPAPVAPMSGLDAAAKVLAESGRPMTTGQMVEQMLAKGYWSSGGKTPAATIYSAILRETQVKGEQARFRKAARGRFELNPTASAAG